MLRTIIVMLLTLSIYLPANVVTAAKRKKDPRVVQSVNRALDYLAR